MPDILVTALSNTQRIAIIVTVTLGLSIIVFAFVLLGEMGPLTTPTLLPPTNTESYNNYWAAIEARITFRFNLVVGQVIKPIFDILFAAIAGVYTIKAVPNILLAFKRTIAALRE